jgi:hypothetical protein
MQLTKILHEQLQIYNLTFLALTDANSSITSSKWMVFAMSYSVERMLKFDSRSYAMDELKYFFLLFSIYWSSFHMTQQ